MAGAVGGACSSLMIATIKYQGFTMLPNSDLIAIDESVCKYDGGALHGSLSLQAVDTIRWEKSGCTELSSRGATDGQARRNLVQDQLVLSCLHSSTSPD